MQCLHRVIACTKTSATEGSETGKTAHPVALGVG